MREFKVGDKVYSKKWGVGEVYEVMGGHTNYPVRVTFKDWPDIGYTKDGRFYVSGTDNNHDITHYSEPEPEKQMFKVGDKVFSKKWGVGEVTEISYSIWPVCVEFEQAMKTFTKRGYYGQEKNPLLDITHYKETDAAFDEQVKNTNELAKLLNSKDLISDEDLDQLRSKIEARRKPETIADRMLLAGAWETEIPDHVRRHLLGDMKATIGYAGEQVSVGDADYSYLNEMREAIEWLVKQFNGEVRWR